MELCDGETGKATARKSEKKKHSTYILLDVPTGVKLDQLSLAGFKKLIFYVGFSGGLKIRLQDHARRIRQDMARYIPLDPKSKRVRAIWKDKRKVVAVYTDSLHSTQALDLEYAIIFDLRRELTNVDDSAQSNQVMYLKHPILSQE
uniref:40S ribosomal protein S25 n=1 Tax=Rhabditophanes sp. KR3021 TaxID=114890 RepID=A0AC35TN72_9BILA